MAGSSRKGGIPGPESRTGLVRPSMTEAEFERRQGVEGVGPVGPEGDDLEPTPGAVPGEAEPAGRAGQGGAGRSRAGRAKAAPAKVRRVQRMFALEEELDKKLWLYAIHMGKDRSEVVNDLLRPVVASMVLYDSRDRRSQRPSDPDADRPGEGDGSA